MSQSFIDFLRGKGFLVRELPADDEIHRFSHTEKPHSKSGWAKMFPEGNVGIWGDWRDSNGVKLWREDGRSYKQLNQEERIVIQQHSAIAKERLQAKQGELALRSEAAWNDIIHTDAISPYLVAKKVGNYGLKIDAEGNAYCPARDIMGKLFNYQNISSNPKLFQQGRMSGCFHLIEGNREQIILASGYATAASIHEMTGLCVAVCFGDGNIIPVAKILREVKYANLKIAADNDSNGSLSGNKVADKAHSLGFNVIMPKAPGDFNDARNAGEDIYSYFFKTTPVFSFKSLLEDSTPMPEDLIEPRILTEGGMLVFGGAPKVGKSDFMLSWLAHMAGGIPFMGMAPPRPLKIFYLQAEVQYHYIRERVKNVIIDEDVLATVANNLFITPQVRMLLDASGVKVVGNTIRQCFGTEGPDIICLDPISNLYDQESENDNAQMMAFLSQRVESLRDYSSEKAAFMLVHHTKKIAKDELAKDPFQMFSGASSLRRYYTTGMLMYRPDETVSECVLTYEVRNGARIPNINVDKDMGSWKIVDKEDSRIHKGDGSDPVAEERARKIAIIISEIEHHNSMHNKHTVNSLSEVLAGTSGLGSSRTIATLVKELVAQNIIFDDLDETGKKRHLFIHEDSL